MKIRLGLVFASLMVSSASAGLRMLDYARFDYEFPEKCSTEGALYDMCEYLKMMLDCALSDDWYLFRPEDLDSIVRGMSAPLTKTLKYKAFQLMGVCLDAFYKRLDISADEKRSLLDNLYGSFVSKYKCPGLKLFHAEPGEDSSDVEFTLDRSIVDGEGEFFNLSHDKVEGLATALVGLLKIPPRRKAFGPTMRRTLCALALSLSVPLVLR